MRLLIESYGDVRVFKDRSIIGLPRYIIESIDPDFGFRYTKVLSGIWYKQKDVLKIAKEMNENIEASPNLPGVSAKITRPRKVTVKYLDKDGMIVRNDFEGLWATPVQHQIDHLNGIMYFDRLSSVKRDMLIRKAKKRR